MGLALKTVLFICSHNSARSQIAEAFLNNLCGDRYQAKSAGVTASQINPYVVRAMAEIGFDLSKNRSKSLMEFKGQNFDVVVTVCDLTREECPFFPGEIELNKSFPDPAQFKGSDEEVLAQVRILRDEIRRWIEETFCKASSLTQPKLKLP